MTPGESHNEWYQYYCSNIYLFKQIMVKSTALGSQMCVKDLYMSITTVKVFWDMSSIPIKIILE